MENNQLIARFNYENKMFCILLRKDKKIIYSYLNEKDEMVFDLNKEELEIVIDVFKTLIIDENNSYYVRDEKIDDRKYKIFYDSKTKNYFWKSLTNENNNQDNIFFNMKYNNMPNIVYSYEEDLKKWYNQDREIKKLKKWHEKKEYRKEIFDKKRKKFISIFINAGLSLVFLADIVALGYVLNKGFEIQAQQQLVATIESPQPKPTSTEILIEEEKSNKEDDNYSWDSIKQVIADNPNLSNEEKELLYKLQFVFDENHQYMNLEMVISRLSNLKITYTNEECKEDLTIVGQYSHEKNAITYYLSESFKNVNISVFLHEIFHVFQTSNGRTIKELSNELFTRETVRRLYDMGELEGFHIGKTLNKGDKYGQGYETWMYIYYYLAELLTQEDLQRYQFTCNESAFVNALCKNSDDIVKDRNLAWELLDIIDASQKTNGQIFYEIPKKMQEEIYERIAYFYQLNGMSLENNINYFAYNLSFFTEFSSTDGDFLLKTLNKTNYMEYDEIMMFYIQTQMKTYFSNVFPKTTIECTFTDRGSSNDCYQILKNNGDYRKKYTITVDEELELSYSNHISNSSKSK